MMTTSLSVTRRVLHFELQLHFVSKIYDFKALKTKHILSLKL